MALSDYRFENLPRSVQMVILALLGVGLCGIFYYYYLKGLTEERDALSEEVRQLEITVAQGTAIASQLRQFKAEIAQLEQRLNELRRILPEQKETPAVLLNVQEMATSSNLKITKFVPRPVVPRAFYADWPIILDVQGSYDGLGLFFEKVSRYTRIVNVDNINIKAVEGSTDHMKTVTATCTATTFVYKEDKAVTATK